MHTRNIILEKEQTTTSRNVGGQTLPIEKVKIKQWK